MKFELGDFSIFWFILEVIFVYVMIFVYGFEELYDLRV